MQIILDQKIAKFNCMCDQLPTLLCKRCSKSPDWACANTKSPAPNDQPPWRAPSDSPPAGPKSLLPAAIKQPPQWAPSNSPHAVPKSEEGGNDDSYLWERLPPIRGRGVASTRRREPPGGAAAREPRRRPSPQLGLAAAFASGAERRGAGEDPV
jgi:hypothetical protein